MTIKPWLLAAVMFSGVASAQSPTMEQRTEAFAEVSEAMTSGNQTGAADALIAVIEDPNWAMFTRRGTRPSCCSTEQARPALCGAPGVREGHGCRSRGCWFRGRKGR